MNLNIKIYLIVMLSTYYKSVNFYLENEGLIKHVLNSDINYWEKVRQV